MVGHIPVLQKEVIDYLNPQPNENFIDATFGLGGHTIAILKRNYPRGKVLGIEWDSVLYQKVSAKDYWKKFGDRLVLVNDSYTHLLKIVEEENIQPVSGILFDLGISSWHLEQSGRGFSFLRDEPLDMRYDIHNPLRAADIVNKWSRSQLQDIFERYGQERFSRRIAQAVVEARKNLYLQTTFQLVEVIKKAVPRSYRHQKIHFATRVFQALRITVNNELDNLKRVLPQSLKILETEGRLVVISFHSLEDKIVKDFLRSAQKDGTIKILTTKPIRPALEEIKKNHRSRSAKLRAAIKL